MGFFTADLHLGHENVIRHCNRPFKNADVMDDASTENWNKRVCENDTVYILGDLIFRTNHLPEDYLYRLKGHKHLIIGNHDYSWLKKLPSGELLSTPATEAFESINHMKVIKQNRLIITLCHYPMMTWQAAGRGGLMVFGYIHNNTNAAYWPLIRASPHMLNAGVDLNDFQPVPLEELMKNNSRFKAASADHIFDL